VPGSPLAFEHAAAIVQGPERPPPRSTPLADLFAEAAPWAALAGVVFLLLDAFAPPQHLPWKPLRLADPIGAATAGKLLRIETDPAACRAVLGDGGVRLDETPTRSDGFCEIRDAVSVRGGTTPLRPAGPVMTCATALSFALWERQVVQPAARAHLGVGVAAIEHYGTYACRRVGGGEAGRISQHGSANALDVAGFRLADGRRITVAADWGDGTAEGRFLRAVRDGACRSFETVLGPEYNLAHRDHLHLDRGAYRLCR
jgi:hypothetical protein